MDGCVGVGVGVDGWMDDLQFYVLLNSISVISGRWVADNERLCANGTPFSIEKIPASGLARTRDHEFRRPVPNPRSYRGYFDHIRTTGG